MLLFISLYILQQCLLQFSCNCPLNSALSSLEFRYRSPSKIFPANCSCVSRVPCLSVWPRREKLQVKLYSIRTGRRSISVLLFRRGSRILSHLGFASQCMRSPLCFLYANLVFNWMIRKQHTFWVDHNNLFNLNATTSM